MKIYKKIILLIAIIIFQISNVQISNAAFVIKKENTQASAQTTTSIIAVSNTTSENTITKYTLAQGKKKDKTVAALFAIFLGGWGAHRFYMGQDKMGYLRLALKIVSILFYIVGYAIVTAAVASSSTELIALFGALMYLLGYAMVLGGIVWNIVDFVRILTGDLEPDGGFEEKKPK
jgi:hypothetical protein